MARFAATNDEEAAEIRGNRLAKNTKKANKSAADTFRAYLAAKGYTLNFEKWPAEQLNDVLKMYYFDVRKVNGELYKTGAMKSMRHALNRHLNSMPFERNIDLIKDPEFRDANLNFDAMLAKLKQEGYGETVHYGAICDADLKLINSSLATSVDGPTGLFNKVQFDVRLYFFRRGAENMHGMTKSHFVISKDENGLEYVATRLDEMTKNHRGTSTQRACGGKMPALPGHPLCPVASFRKYISKLHPSCPKLWQRARDSFLDDEPVWYCNSPVGEKALQKFMPNLSHACKLSRRYSNHCVRATGATILTVKNYAPAQIMSVTGHKSAGSLTVYQGVDDAKKIEMGQALGDHIASLGQEVVPYTGPITSNGIRAAAPRQDESAIQLQNLQLDDWNFDVDFFPNNSALVRQPPQPSTTGMISLPGGASIPVGMFQNCQINNLNIHLPGCAPI